MSNAYKSKKAVEINQPPFALSEPTGYYPEAGLKFDAIGRSGEWNHIPDVADAGDHHQKTFKAQAKAGMWYITKFP